MTEIRPVYLGLTILALGNSLLDFFNDTDIARKGSHVMAVTGVLAGPIFNLIMGLGLAMVM